MHEALEALAARGIYVNALRVRGFPFQDEIADFVASHTKVFVVEQNRDAQLKTLAGERGRREPRQPDPDPALRRHADHRALHHRGDRRAGPATERATAAEGRANDLPRQAQAPPPDPAEEPARLHAPRLRGQDLDAVRRAAATTRSRAAIIQACWELAIEPHRVAKLSGIGCSSKTPDYFLGNSHGFNSVHGRMPVGGDRGEPRQPRPALPRRVRRRRLGVDRPRPVRALHAPRREHGLRRREQRRLRPHQGPVLRHRRPRLEVQARRREHRRLASTW